MRVLPLAAIAIALPLHARVNFLRDVKPILENHCVRCHGNDAAMKNLRLDRDYRAMRAIVPKKPEESRIYMAAKSGFMPPGPRKLSPEELETLRKWIREGAKWPKGAELEGKNPFIQ
jgi:mono/diheme cytochrome c family protein